MLHHKESPEKVQYKMATPLISRQTPPIWHNPPPPTPFPSILKKSNEGAGGGGGGGWGSNYENPSLPKSKFSEPPADFFLDCSTPIFQGVDGWGACHAFSAF